METKNAAVQTKWAIDPMHSEVQFKVKHLVISTVTGYFREFSGSISSEGTDFDGATANFEANIQSIDTNVTDRDTHLKSDDFFNAEKYPTLNFSNGVFHQKEKGVYQLEGDLTIRDFTKRVALKAEFGGKMVDGYGQTKVGFDISGKISRKEFGLKWNQVTEAGGVVVGDEVRLQLNVQFIEQ